LGRQLGAAVAARLGISYPTLQHHFDALDFPEGVQCAPPPHAVNLLIDATFFGRTYGYLCFHDTRRIIWFKEIKTESVRHLRDGLHDVLSAGYRFASVTLNGRRGYAETIQKALGPVPIQMCLFHQKAIVRRYITDRPSTPCAQELKALMATLCHSEPEVFVGAFYRWKQRYAVFLEERNTAGEYRHRKLRAAARSLQENMHRLFTHHDMPDANIPTTINHLEGAFSHLKERIRIHRGLRLDRKKKAIKFLLSSPTLF
jgi:hypothetical protein